MQMQSTMMFYTIMPDGTVKQVNPFTGTEVWAVAGRRGRPMINEQPENEPPLELHAPEDYCSFCPPRYMEVAPENWMDDPGFALTQGNWEEKANDMWGCKLFAEGGESLDRTFEMP